MQKKITFTELNATVKNRQPVIFGAGHLCHKTLLRLQKCPTCIVDNSGNLWNTEQENIKINAPDYLKSKSPKPFVIICTTSFPEVVNQIRSLGYADDTDFCVSPLLNDWRTIEELQSHRASLLFTSGLSSSGTSAAVGGLYHLKSQGKEYALTHIIEGSAHGITKVGDFIYLIEDSLGIIELTPDLEITRSNRLPAGSRPHGLTWSDVTGSFYVPCSYLDQVLELNQSLEVTRTFDISKKASMQHGPHHHVNDCLAWGGSLFVSMFSLTGNWKKDVFDGGIVEFDILSGQRIGIFANGLWMPHNIANVDGSMAVLDSLPGDLLYGNLRQSGSFPGFTRGLSWGDEYFYIGQSRNRNFSAQIGISKNISLDSGIVIFDNATKLSKTLDLPDSITEIHGILSIS